MGGGMLLLVAAMHTLGACGQWLASSLAAHRPENLVHGGAVGHLPGKQLKKIIAAFGPHCYQDSRRQRRTATARSAHERLFHPAALQVHTHGDQWGAVGGGGGRAAGARSGGRRGADAARLLAGGAQA